MNCSTYHEKAERKYKEHSQNCLFHLAVRHLGVPTAEVHQDASLPLHENWEGLWEKLTREQFN